MSSVGANALFNVLDLIAGALQIVYGFIIYENSFEGYIIPIYIIFFGLSIFIMVFYIPKWLLTNIPFFNHFLGRSLTFLFNALLVIDPSGFGFWAGIYIALISTIYFIIWILNKNKCTHIVLPPPFFFSQDDNIQHQYTRQLAKSITTTNLSLQQDNHNNNNNNNDDYFG